MSGFLNTISNACKAGANGIRNGVLSSQELKDRSDFRKYLELIKVAVVVTAVASVLLTALLPSIFSVCLTALDLFISREIVVIAQNICEMLDHSKVEAHARFSKNNLIDQICKNTFITRSIFLITEPDLKDFVLINS